MIYQQIVKFYIYLIFGCGLIFLSACSEQDNYEVVSSEEVLPQAKRNYDVIENEEEKDTPKMSPLEERLIDSLHDIQFSKENDLRIEDTRILPNQLGYKEKKETFFNYDSIPYHFLEWTFADSTQTVNAFYNWLDCFGNDCRSIKINEEVNGCKQAFITWVSNTNITYLESTEPIDRRKWEQLFFNKKRAWNYIIQQAPKHKVNWVKSPLKTP